MLWLRSLLPLLSALLLLRGLSLAAQASVPVIAAGDMPAMFFSDTSRIGVPFAKDPSVIEFGGRTLMYYSLPPLKDAKAKGEQELSGWGIGIAESHDLVHWTKVGELTAVQPVERDGIAAPGARVIDGVVHVFYQTYGHGAHDAICHATSRDGIHFEHDPGNPVYHPTRMAWSVGRAIDAEVLVDDDRVLLYFATRDPTMTRQMIGMASAPRHSKLGAGDWCAVCAEELIRPDIDKKTHSLHSARGADERVFRLLERRSRR